MSTALSLSELSAFDPGYRSGAEQRYCCPLPSCAGKVKSRAHRSRSLNAMHIGLSCMGFVLVLVLDKPPRNQASFTENCFL